MQVPVLKSHARSRSRPCVSAERQRIKLTDADPTAGPSVQESCDLSANEPSRREAVTVCITPDCQRGAIVHIGYLDHRHINGDLHSSVLSGCIRGVQGEPRKVSCRNPPHGVAVCGPFKHIIDSNPHHRNEGSPNSDHIGRNAA